jgi:hypothetical protein
LTGAGGEQSGSLSLRECDLGAHSPVRLAYGRLGNGRTPLLFRAAVEAAFRARGLLGPNG